MQFMLLFEAIRQDRSRIFGAENDEIAVRYFLPANYLTEEQSVTI